MGYPSLTQNFKPNLSYGFNHADYTQINFRSKMEIFLHVTPHVCQGNISAGQPSPGPFHPNMGTSPGVPQFDPEFQTQPFLCFSPRRLHPNQFPVKMETFFVPCATPGQGQDEFWSAQPRAIAAKYGYVSGCAPV